MKKLHLLFRNLLITFVVEYIIYGIPSAYNDKMFTNMSYDFIIFNVLLYAYVITNSLRLGSSLRAHSTIIIPKDRTEY
jgi:hypothetical protein